MTAQRRPWCRGRRNSAATNSPQKASVEQRQVLLTWREEMLMKRIEVVDGTTEQVITFVT